MTGHPSEPGGERGTLRPRPRGGTYARVDGRWIRNGWRVADETDLRQVGDTRGFIWRYEPIHRLDEVEGIVAQLAPLGWEYVYTYELAYPPRSAPAYRAEFRRRRRL